MNMKHLKDIVCFAIVVCLSLFHVHCSIYTVDNGANPATLMLMLSEDDEVFIFYTIQFAVTAFISYLVLNYNSLYKWLLSYLFILPVSLYLDNHFWDYHHTLQHLAINETYYDFYGYGQAFTTAAICMSLQLLAIIAYLVLGYITSSTLYCRVQNYFVLKKSTLWMSFLIEYKYQLLAIALCLILIGLLI